MYKVYQFLSVNVFIKESHLLKSGGSTICRQGDVSAKHCYCLLNVDQQLQSSLQK